MSFWGCGIHGVGLVSKRVVQVPILLQAMEVGKLEQFSVGVALRNVASHKPKKHGESRRELMVLYRAG